LGPLHLLHNLCEASYRMGKWFATNGFRPSRALEGTKSPLARLLLLLIIEGITSKCKHTVKYPDLLSAMRPVPHIEASEQSTVIDDNSDSEDH